MIDWEPVECEVEALPVADPTEGDMGESQGAYIFLRIFIYKEP